MRQIFKNIFRERNTSILLIIGFSLSFFVTINGINIINRLINIRNNELSSRYLNQMSICLEEQEGSSYEKEKVERLIQDLNSIDTCNVVYNDFGYVYGMQMNIYYMQKPTESIAVELKEGRYATIEEIENHEKVAIIGEGLKEYLEKNDGDDYITVGTEKYKVVGILENISDDYEENLRVYLYMDSLSESSYNVFVEKMVWEGSLTIDIASNYTDLKKELDYIYSLKNEYAFDIRTYEVEANDILELTVSRKMEKIYMIILAVFVLVNCILVSDIWIERRMNEFAVRKACGMGFGKILLTIIKQISPLLILSLVLSMIMEAIYILVTKTNIEKVYWNDIIYLLVASVVMMIITLIIPMIKINKIKPAKALSSL